MPSLFFPLSLLESQLIAPQPTPVLQTQSSLFSDRSFFEIVSSEFKLSRYPNFMWFDRNFWLWAVAWWKPSLIWGEGNWLPFFSRWSSGYSYLSTSTYYLNQSGNRLPALRVLPKGNKSSRRTAQYATGKRQLVQILTARWGIWKIKEVT